MTIENKASLTLTSCLNMRVKFTQDVFHVNFVPQYACEVYARRLSRKPRAPNMGVKFTQDVSHINLAPQHACEVYARRLSHKPRAPICVRSLRKTSLT